MLFCFFENGILSARRLSIWKNHSPLWFYICCFFLFVSFATNTHMFYACIDNNLLCLTACLHFCSFALLLFCSAYRWMYRPPILYWQDIFLQVAPWLFAYVWICTPQHGAKWTILLFWSLCHRALRRSRAPLCLPCLLLALPTSLARSRQQIASMPYHALPCRRQASKAVQKSRPEPQPKLDEWEDTEKQQLCSNCKKNQILNSFL